MAVSEDPEGRSAHRRRAVRSPGRPALSGHVTGAMIRSSAAARGDGAPGREGLRCRRCCLGSLCLPAGVQPAEVALLDSVVDTRRELAEGEVLVEEDAPLRALWVVRSGSLKAETRWGGRVQVVAFHLPGELVGWDAIAGGRYRTTIRALEPSTLCVVRYQRLMGLGDRIPRLHRRLLAMLSGAAHRDWVVSAVGAGVQAEARVLAFLLSLAERLVTAGLSVDEVRLSMSRDDIASYLGLAPETVSRAMVRVGRLDCLEVRRRRVRFHDLGALRAALRAMAAS